MEGEEEEEEEEEVKQKKKNNNNNISKSAEKQEEKKNSEEMEMDDECESSPLQSPLHTLDDDDDDVDDHHHHKPSSLKKEKPFFHRPLPPQILHPPQPQPQQRQLPPPPYLDPQPQPQPQRKPPPPYLNPPQPQRQPPPLLNPPNHSTTAISIMNPPNQSTAMVSVDRKPYRFSPVRSPPLEKMNLPHTIPPPPPSETVTVKPQSPVFVVNRTIQEELSSGVSKMDSNGGDVEDGVGNRKPRAAVPSVLSRQRKEDMVKRAALGFRVCAVVCCLVSFSVMAADKTQGWAGDSFDRYKEYRYCISVTIIGFVYASFQAYDLAYNLITEKHIIPYYIRYYFDFSMDQILTYLLISASSSAATRVDDWQTNWGKDEFTIMASASVGMSFMAFVAFAFSSLISGYNLCMRNYNN